MRWHGISPRRILANTVSAMAHSVAWLWPAGAGLRIEAVARAGHGDEVPRLLGVELEPLAQLADEVVDRAHRARRLAPHQLEQLGAGEHLAGVADEEHQELELQVRELDLDPTAGHQALAGLDRDVAEREVIAMADRDRHRRGRDLL